MQRDSGTYCDEPEDEKDFATWVADFNLDDRYTSKFRFREFNAIYDLIVTLVQNGALVFVRELVTEMFSM